MTPNGYLTGRPAARRLARGFGNATALGHHFRAWRGTTPNAYRRMFRGDHAGPVLTGR